MIAVQHNSGQMPKAVHANVVEIESDRPSRKRFKCLHCGYVWYEATNSPVIQPGKVSMTNIKDYYPDYFECKQQR